MDMSLLAGPFGGLIAMAFGVGAAAGYGFSSRTVLKMANERIDEVKADAAKSEAECNRRIGNLEVRQRELEDMLLGRRALGFFTEPTDRKFSQQIQDIDKADNKGGGK